MSRLSEARRAALLRAIRAAVPDADVPDNAADYVVGYWARIANQRRPVAREARSGWERADRELADETAAE